MLRNSSLPLYHKNGEKSITTPGGLWYDRSMVRYLAQMFLKRDGKILLGLKKRGFGKGKLVSPGGKVDPGETVMQAAIRECEEESGVKVHSCTEVALVVFRDLYYKGEPETDIMYAFVSEDFEGEPVETDELVPEWHPIDELPFERMWKDAQYWMPDAMRGRKVDSYFRYNEKDELVEHEVDIVPDQCIIRLRDKDFGLPEDGDESGFVTRTASRAVLIDKDYRVALVDATSRGYYKLPGGGIDEGELISEALHREVREEAGYTIEPLAALGYVHETRHKFEQFNISYAFLARAKEFVGTNLMEDEIEDGFELKWFDNIDEAIKAVEAVDTSDMVYQAKFFTARELAILRAARKVLKEQYGQ